MYSSTGEHRAYPTSKNFVSKNTSLIAGLRESQLYWEILIKVGFFEKKKWKITTASADRSQKEKRSSTNTFVISVIHISNDRNMCALNQNNSILRSPTTFYLSIGVVRKPFTIRSIGGHEITGTNHERRH